MINQTTRDRSCPTHRHLLSVRASVLMAILATSPLALRAEKIAYTVDPAKVEAVTSVGLHGQFLEHIFNSVHGGLWGDAILNPSLELNGGPACWVVTNDMVTLPAPITNRPLRLGDEKWTDYEVTLEARRDEGSEGFLVLFRATQHRDYWINFGGWQNAQHGIEKHGGSIKVPRVAGAIEAGRWYKVRIVCAGTHFEVYLDGQKVFDFDDTEQPFRSGCIGLNAWNTRASFRNIRVVAPDGKVLLEGLPAEEDFVEMPAYWSRCGVPADGRLALASDGAFNGGTAVALRCSREGGEFGIEQAPINITQGETYRGSLHLRSGVGSAAAARVVSRDGKVLFTKTFKALPADWQKVEFSFKAAQSDPEARFQVLAGGTGEVQVDMVNFFPQSALDVGGFRPQLLKAIADLKPATIRYPGGCFASAYRWKDGIGPREKRTYFPNVIWADRDPNQFGTDEFVDLCRRVGAQPVIAINTGAGLQESLDWVEYCNGSATSQWGRVRAANGHPEPYGVKYWEVDNETWHMGVEKYAETVNQFSPALRAKDPSIVIAACGSYGYDDGKGSTDGWNRKLLEASATNINLLSIHYYNGICYPQDFVSDPRRFEGFIRDEIGPLIRNSANPKMQVYCSEWGQMNIEWRSGLYTAGLLNSFERIGSELLPMSCPAVWLQLVGTRGIRHPRWGSSHILFDQRDWFPAPTYVVQKLWREHFGPKVLAITGPNWPLNTVVSASEDGQTLFMKTVNVEEKSFDVELEIAPGFEPGKAEALVVAPGSLKAANWLDKPAEVAAVVSPVEVSGQCVRFKLPPQSVAALSVRRKSGDAERGPR